MLGLMIGQCQEDKSRDRQIEARLQCFSHINDEIWLKWSQVCTYSLEMIKLCMSTVHRSNLTISVPQEDFGFIKWQSNNVGKRILQYLRARNDKEFSQLATKMQVF